MVTIKDWEEEQREYEHLFYVIHRMLCSLFIQMFTKNLLYVAIFTLLGDFEIQDASM